MTDNNEDMDDFDIYADLDDNIDLNINVSDNCILNFCETDLPSILMKTAETCDQINDNIEDTMTQSIDTLVYEDINEEQTTDCVDNKPDNKFSNDMILSEITILEKSLNKTEDNNKSLVHQIQQLRQQMKEKDRQLAVLKTNISSLYKTAKAEIERKKQEINGLREELDSLIFRRLARNGLKVDDNKSVVQQNRSQEIKSNDCHKSCQTIDSDFSFDANIKKKSPDSSVRSPKERPMNDRRTRRSRSKSSQRTRRRTRSKSKPKTRNNSPKSPKKIRRSRSKSVQRSRRSLSRSSQRNRKERLRSADRSRTRTNNERQSKNASEHKNNDNQRKSDKSMAKPSIDPKSDKKN